MSRLSIIATNCLSLLTVLLLFTQCNTQKVAVVEPTEIRITDTVYIKPEPEEAAPKPYRATADRPVDLIHTDLSLTFNYADKEVNGKAKLTCTPTFYPIDNMSLDAKNFSIKEVTMKGRPLKFTYDDKKLYIEFENSIERGENFDVYINYTAHPYKGKAGGSAAIMSDRGLYFIDADESDPYKPTQIWTQGETESSSKWFPTIDKPNERCTQKIRVRVKDEYETLSNGLLTNSKKHDDGTRTDTWEMTKPHAPYLFMLAIGDFHRATDQWEDIPLEYMVEHDYAPDAKAIFNYTPEMLSYFSNILDYKYPWDKYSQVIARDYISGAMENTTASLYGQFLQRPMGDLIDNGNDKIVAHELFHHWFGDLVTCESWSNLTLNEGFANYSEYLWLAYKYGRDEGELHRFNETQGYLASAAQYAHPLIDFHYDNKEDMFDAHSYNKGGLVLHMLREIVGDEAFFTALNHYLNEKDFEAAEVHDLRLSFEEVTGLDLNWFFNQWFLEPGHPVIEMDHTYNPETGYLTVNVRQIQNKDWPIFRIPTEIEIYPVSGGKIKRKIILDKKENTFNFELKDKAALVVLDPKNIQLFERQYEQKPSLLAYEKASSVWNKLAALELLDDEKHEDRAFLAKKAIDDSFYAVRLRTIQSASNIPEIANRLAEIAEKDPNANVRVAAVDQLETMPEALLVKALNDKSNRVRAAAAMYLMENDKERALKWADEHNTSTSQSLLQAVGDIYVDQELKGKSDFFERSADRMSFDSAFPFYISWAGYLVNEDAAAVALQLEKWNAQISSEETGIYKKYAILTALQPLAQFLPVDSYGEEDKTKIQGLIQQIGMKAAMLFQGS